MPDLKYNLIGIVGHKRSGKDTFARHIQGVHGGQVLQFAAPIKKMLSEGLGIPLTDPLWEEDKEQPIPWLGVSTRKLMQTLGTEWGREIIHPEFWTKLLERSLIPNIVPVIVSDVRFPNEQHWIKKHGGILIGINRLGTTNDKHKSEDVDFSLCSHVIQNKYTLADFEIASHKVIKDVLETRKPVHSKST